ncbi:MAG: FKBP-type peptidyl-prolyl cis-trans isomerase [Nanoarchaeota archaeon]
MKKLYIILIVILLILASTYIGYRVNTMENIAQDGDTVDVHYTGSLEDGTIFDSSAGREPLKFTLGSGQVLEHFNDGIIGMKEGETKEIVIPAGEGYNAGPLAGKKMIFEVELVKIY